MAAKNFGRTWLGRLLRGRRGPAPLDPARADLVVVVSGYDDAEAASAALARGTGWRPAEQAVLRHHLVLPTAAVEAVLSIVAQDGYAADGPSRPRGDGTVELGVQRVQVLDALHCSQERSRMAGLAARHDGTVLGWDARQPGGAD
ncbi:MAG TPA: hypothetical protein VIW24_23325 [Aldersonia sp.]